MTAMKHVYLTAHGSWPTGAWVGETAQIGIRCAFAPTLTAPLKGDVWTPQLNGDITKVYGTQAGANGTLAKTWTARVGGLASEENCGPTEQIDMAEDFRTFLNAVKGYQTNTFRWTHVKIAAVDATGHSPEVSSVYTFTAPIVGASAGGALPPQVAMALSTRANLVGRRGRGRVYIPGLSQNTLAADGTLATAAADACRAAFKTLIDNLQAQPGFTLNMPIVFVGSSDSLDVVRPVEVRTGNKLDTIQSRRRQVAESYATTAL